MLDVVFLCEGTYPFVPGGVSSWVHSLIVGMPDLKFGIVYLHTSEKDELKMRYELPPNLHDLVVFNLYDMVCKPQTRSLQREHAWLAVRPFLKGIIRGESVGFDQAAPHLCGTRGSNPSLSMEELSKSYEAWEILTDAYRDTYPNASFNDFFWSWRYAFLPLFKVFHAEVPEAKVYHTVTTGWTGVLAAATRSRTRRPFIVTEHGLYVNERRIEISQADWIHVDAPTRGKLEIGLGTFKEIWINLFLALGKLCYQTASEILTLYGGNKVRQVEFGAPEERIQIVPNGIDIQAFQDREPALPKSKAFRVGLIGRVVPIKDIKTFIKAIRQVADEIDDLEVYICGPIDEDPEYYAACETLVDALGLERTILFTGRVDVRHYYPCLDVQVLTSISEGQPLVILEGYCTGLPCVASDVGACSELIHGMDAEDRSLGSSGIVTWVGNPTQTAEAILKLYRDPELRARMGESAKRRVHRYYQRRDMLEAYHNLYLQYMEQPDLELGKVRV